MPSDVLYPDAPHAPRFHPVEIPHAPNFHPELGYLLPSRSLQRKLRRAAATALVGVAIAASTALALMPRSATEGNRHESPPVEAVSRSVLIEHVAAVAPAPPPVQQPPGARGACDDLSTAFLAVDCRSGRIGKARLAHARASHRLATVTIGRADAEPEPQETPPAAAAPAPANGAGAPMPPPAVQAKPKAPVKAARKERPSQDAAAADPGMRGNSSGLFFPHVVIPSLFGGADWARSW